MINPQEAYEYLYNLLELSGDLKWPLCIDSMQIFKDLVDKTTPKEAHISETILEDCKRALCPVCDNFTYYYRLKPEPTYCTYCGQKFRSVNNENI